MVTVAVRRVNFLDKKPALTDYLNPKKIIFLPNTQVVSIQRKLWNFKIGS